MLRGRLAWIPTLSVVVALGCALDRVAGTPFADPIKLPKLASRTMDGVDPFLWTLHPLGEEESRCHESDAGNSGCTRRSFASN